MPKEIITPGDKSTRLIVNWGRAAYVDIGIKLNPIARLNASKFKFVDDQGNVGDLTYDSLWSETLSRQEINKLIRDLRRARDQVFGADA